MERMREGILDIVEMSLDGIYKEVIYTLPCLKCCLCPCLANGKERQANYYNDACQKYPI